MRKFAVKALLLALTLGIFVPAGLFASEINVTIDGVPVVFTGQSPVLTGGRTLVPLRGVFEHLGFDVDWHQNTVTATLTNDYYEIIISIDSLTFTTNGEAHPLDEPAQIIGGRTLLPIRAVLESVGFDVGWCGDTNTVIISTLPIIFVPPDDFYMSSMETVMTLPDRRLTEAERQEWIDNYIELGGPSYFELELVDLVNEIRAQYGLSEVAIDDALMMAARFYTQTMSQLNTGLGHNMGPYAVPGATHGASRAVAEAFGAQLTLWNGGNAGQGRHTPEAQVDAWMDSQAHRTFILSEEHRYIGVGRFGPFSYLFLSDQGSLSAALAAGPIQTYAPVATPVPTPSPTPTPAPRAPRESTSAVNAAEFEARVFELVNIERQSYGVSPVIWSNTLADAALAHSRDLASTNSFSHTSSDGTTLRARIARTGIVNMGAAENISGGFTTPEAAMISWMNSPGHRANILNPTMTHLGVGFYHLPGSQWEFYVTQKFIAAP